MVVFRAAVAGRDQFGSRLTLLIAMLLALLAMTACGAKIAGVTMPGGGSKKEKQAAEPTAANQPSNSTAAPTEPAGDSSSASAPQPAAAPSSNARPLDSNSKIRLDRAKEAVAQIHIKEELRKNVPVARAEEVVKERDNVRMYVDNANNELRMVRDDNHPDVVAFKQGLPRYEAYLADLDKVAAAHTKQLQAASALQGKFFGEYRQYGEHLKLYYALVNEPDGVHVYGERKDLIEAKEALAKIHQGCTGPYKELAKGSTDDSNGLLTNPALICHAAAMGDELVKRRVVNVAMSQITTATEALKAQLAVMDQDDGRLKKADLEFLWNPESLKTRVKERYGADLKFVGASLDEGLFADAEKARQALLAEIPKHVARWKFGAHGSRASDGFITRSYKKAGKGVKIKQIQLLKKGWTVKLNALGVPKYRFKRGGILYQLPGEKWCHEDTFVYYQDYQGGKRYGKSYFEHGPKNLKQYRICSCK